MPSKSKHSAKKSFKDHSVAQSHSNEPAKDRAHDRNHHAAAKPDVVPAKLAPAPAVPADAAKEFKEKALENLTGDLNEKIRYLIRLSKEQGYLTYADINEALPESVDNPEDIENVISILQNLEIDILDPEEVDNYKQRQEEAEEEESRTSSNDILDDLVRMYLKQMGQVPLLTREQEVEISKRIETAEINALAALFALGPVGKHLSDLGEKLLLRTERFDRLVIDKKIESRDVYFKNLQKLVEVTRSNDAIATEAWNDALIQEYFPAGHHGRLAYLPLDDDEDLMELEIPKVPLLLEFPHITRRVAAQRSRFIVFGTDPNWLAEESQKPDSPIKEIPIDGSFSYKIRLALRDSGVTESVIFPDLDGLGREMRQLWEDRK